MIIIARGVYKTDGHRCNYNDDDVCIDRAVLVAACGRAGRHAGRVHCSSACRVCVPTVGRA